MKYVRFSTLLLAALAMACLIGCGASEKAGDAAKELANTATDVVEDAGKDLTGTASGLVEEIAEMAPEELKAKTAELTETIVGKEAELKEIAGQLKELSPTDMMGDKAKELKAKSESLTGEIASLKDKLQSYTDKLTE